MYENRRKENIRGQGKLPKNLPWMIAVSVTLILTLAACGKNTVTVETEKAAPAQEVSEMETPEPEAEEMEPETEAPEQEAPETEISENREREQEVSEPEEAPAGTLAEEPEAAPAVRLVMVGDMLMHERVMDSGLQEDGSYRFDHLFTHVSERIADADLALVNQETILGGTELGLTGYPCFNSPYELGTAEVEAGFDVILHGTNHALDKGRTGVWNCMDFWEEQYPQIACLGINRTREQQEDIYIYEQDGIRIAILNYTYGTNGIPAPEDMPYLVNYLEEDRVTADLEQAEELADFTVVCPHWGTEYQLGISEQQEYWTELFFQQGADLVIGTHPHVIEPVEWIQDEEGHEMLVYYSLGNFVNGTAGTGEGVMNRCVGGMAEVTVGREEDGTVAVQEYEIIPLVCHIAEGEEYSVWYLEDYTEELAEENKICSQDPAFSLENCRKLVEQVWRK